MLEQDDKNYLDQPLTKGKFKEHLETLVKVVANKEDLKDIENRLTNNITGFKDEILTSNDKVIQKLDKIIAELPATTHHLDEHDKEITKLKTRTARLEVQVGIAN